MPNKQASFPELDKLIDEPKKPIRKPRKPKQAPVENQITYCGPANNALQHVPNKKKRYKEDKKAKTLTYARDTNFILTISECGKTLSVEALMLLCYAQILLSKVNGWRKGESKTTIIIDFDDYAAWRGIKTPKGRMRLRDEIQESLKVLLQVNVIYRHKSKKCSFGANLIASFNAFTENKNDITINFTQEFANYTTNNFIIQIDPALFRISAKNPNAFKIGHKLCEQWHSEKLRKNGTHNRLMLTTLVEAAPDLPTLEEEKAEHRHYRRNIFVPIDNILEHLKDLGFLTQFEWRKKGGAYLTDSQLATLTYDELKEVCLHFELPEKPRQLSLAQA